MADILYTVLAIGLVILGLGFSLLIFAIPFIVVAKLTGVTSFRPRRGKNLQAKMVEAQWEYDRLWNRKK